MLKPLAPCKGCEKRRAGCHSECEEYRAYIEDQKKYKELKYTERWDEFADYVFVRRSKRRGTRSK